MKIIITESQLQLLNENNMSKMTDEELYERAIKLKKVVTKAIKKKLENFDWLDDIKIQIDKSDYPMFKNVPRYHIILKTKVSVEDHSFPNKKIREEILDEIDDIFQEFFPRINLDTKLTGVWNGYLQDPDDYVFYI